MARARRTSRIRRPTSAAVRYTIDASVFVNAFNPHERGHAESLAVLEHVHERGAPLLLPVLVLPEVASAIARATGDEEAALEYAAAIAALPHATLVTLTPAVAREAAQLAATNRLRGADAIYAAVARRYATTLVTRDDQQRLRAAAVVACVTPEEARAIRA